MPSPPNKTHGLSNTREYWIWQQLVARCSNPKHQHYKYYGGRGIRVCQRWLKFVNFYQDMGAKPEGLSLDRKDNNKGYSKSNCRWATRREQQNNTRFNRLLSVNGRTLTVSQWAADVGLPISTLSNRLARGWDARSAVLTPKQPRPTFVRNVTPVRN